MSQGQTGRNETTRHSILTRRFRFFEPTRAYREMTVLGQIAADPGASQRQLAARTLLGTTMLHNYISSLESGGLLEVSGDSNRSTSYALTPMGAYRRDELFFQASKEIVQFYGLAKREFHQRLTEHARAGSRRVVLFGAAETGEIAIAAAPETGLEIVGIVDSDPQKQGRMLGTLRISAPELIEAMRPDTVLICSFGHADEIHQQTRHLQDQGIRVVRV